MNRRVVIRISDRLQGWAMQRHRYWSPLAPPPKHASPLQPKFPLQSLVTTAFLSWLSFRLPESPRVSSDSVSRSLPLSFPSITASVVSHGIYVSWYIECPVRRCPLSDYDYVLPRLSRVPKIPSWTPMVIGWLIGSQLTD